MCSLWGVWKFRVDFHLTTLFTIYLLWILIWPLNTWQRMINFWLPICWLNSESWTCQHENVVALAAVSGAMLCPGVLICKSMKNFYRYTNEVLYFSTHRVTVKALVGDSQGWLVNWIIIVLIKSWTLINYNYVKYAYAAIFGPRKQKRNQSWHLK